MAVSLKDVAQAAGVSIKTVSNVVNDYPFVSADTRSRVQSVIDELGYRPNLSARRLRSGRSGLLALSIPEIAKNGTPLTDRPLVLVLTTSVVVVTLVGQGFTLAPVVRASGIALEPAHTAREETEARSHLAHAGLARLEELAELEAVPDIVLDRLRRGLTARLDDARDRLAEHNGTAVATESAELVYRQLRRDLIAVETSELQRLYDAHRISDTTRRRLQRSLDLEEARLADA